VQDRVGTDEGDADDGLDEERREVELLLDEEDGTAHHARVVPEEKSAHRREPDHARHLVNRTTTTTRISVNRLTVAFTRSATALEGKRHHGPAIDPPSGTHGAALSERIEVGQVLVLVELFFIGATDGTSAVSGLVNLRYVLFPASAWFVFVLLLLNVVEFHCGELEVGLFGRAEGTVVGRVGRAQDCQSPPPNKCGYHQKEVCSHKIVSASRVHKSMDQPKQGLKQGMHLGYMPYSWVSLGPCPRFDSSSRPCFLWVHRHSKTQQAGPARWSRKSQ
jgi:hypothetical protein